MTNKIPDSFKTSKVAHNNPSAVILWLCDMGARNRSQDERERVRREDGGAGEHGRRFGEREFRFSENTELTETGP